VGPVLTAQQRIGRLLDSGPYLLASGADEIVVVVPAAGARRRVLGVIEDLNARLPVRVAGGAGRPVRFAELAVSAEQARMAAHAGGSAGFAEFGELGPLPMLLGGRTDTELRVFAGPLDPLVDDGDGAALVMSLAAFLRCNGQMESAAADLGIHRHTMRNRMRRITALLDDDLESAYTRAELLLAVTAYRLLAERGR
jgi:PucR family transcriptional regulator, purine catabolism regulatory protein